MRGARQIIGAAIDFALPPRCAACGAIVPDTETLCRDCWSDLQFLTDMGCVSCGTPLPPTIEQCAPCMQRPPDHDGAAAAVVYGNVARTIALRLKHGRRVALARFVARAMARRLPQGEDWLLVPVPLHRWRIWSRGFNQAKLIADHLGRIAGLPIDTDSLVRIKRTPSMGSMGARERSQTLARAFAVPPARKQLISGRDILLVDDVYTSGATSNGCARVLKRAGAAQVRLISWARVVRGD